MASVNVVDVEVRSIALGSGFKLNGGQIGLSSAGVATGIEYYEAGGDSTSYFNSTRTADGSHAADRVAEAAFFGAYAPATSASAYLVSINGEGAPFAWARTVVTPEFGVSFYASARITAGTAALTNRARGPLYDATQFPYVAVGATYAQFLTYVVTLRFDSQCKLDTYLVKAGSTSSKALLPDTDSAGLGAYLRSAGGTLAVDVLGMGKATAVNAALSFSSCADDDLAGCRAILESLDQIVGELGSDTLPGTFEPVGGPWQVDAYDTAETASIP